MRNGAGPLPGAASSRTLDAMDPLPTPPEPGNFTVPLLFGWGDILLVLVLLIVAVVVFLLVTASTPAASRRSEWQAWLDGRSRTVDADRDDVRGER